MLIRLLKKYLRPYSWRIVFILVLQLIGAITTLYLPSLNADIIDQGVAKGDTGRILTLGGWMLGVTLLQIAAVIVATYFAATTAMGFGRDVRGALFHRVGTFSEREVTQFGAPSLITRTTNDVQQVQTLVVMSATLMVSAPIMFVGGIIMAIKQDVGLSWLVAVAVPVLVVAIGFIARKMVPQFRMMQVKLDAVNRVLREQITGVRVVRAFVREGYEADRFATANQQLTATSLAVGKLFALMFPIVMLVLNASSVAVLWFGGLRIDSGAIEVGTLTAFLTYLMQILMSVMMATFMLVMIPRAAVCAERVGEVLDTETSVTPPTVAASLDAPLSGRIELNSVTFSYPGADDPVLRDIDLVAEPGTTTAIIGSTGAGKTTLVNLVPRLFDATDGEVLLGGVNVRDLDPDTLWAAMALVPQRSYLFSGTVASNLRFGNEKATDEELWEALRVAQAEDFVSAMPGGLDAAIAQGGTNVSGGQRQRLAIARALVRKPAVCLLDDSFSALDTTTDARVRAALRPYLPDMTMIVVAQRVSTIRDADQILVLEDGEIVGRGRHDELVETCETYAEIVSSQLSAEASA